MSKTRRRQQGHAESAILADVEPGFQFGGSAVEMKKISAKSECFGNASGVAGRQDAALHGRQDACRYNARES
jgi:hypothetical protein